MKSLFFHIKNSKSEYIVLIFLLLLSGVIHGYNMFGYPYFENDEGTYFAQAWSFLTKGQLAPYTYWYDHAPFGWIFTSLWIYLTGGLFTFGFSLNSARVFMLMIHLVSTFLLFKVTKKITNSQISAIIACLFFALSPLGVYFQRRLLLDNLMIFWVLLSLFFILFSRNHLKYFFLSAIAFGFAVLTKENAIFLFPVMAGLVYFQAHSYHKNFAFIKWIAISLIIISLYPLYALLKGELFPTGSIFASAGEHVSLLGTLKNQSSRGTGLPFWYPNSDFMTNFFYWYNRDTFFVLIAIGAYGIQAFFAIFRKSSRIIFLLTTFTLLFFLTGKLVINFYIIPLIPLFGMCIGETIHVLLKPFGYLHKAIPAILSLFIIGGVLYYYSLDNNLKIALVNNETQKQLEALDWVKKNINSREFIAIDYYGNLDLSESRFKGDRKFSNADWYWKVEFDPEITTGKLKNDPRNINYIMLTSQMYKDMNSFPPNASVLKQAIRNSSKIILFTPEKEKIFKLSSFIPTHPNGDWVAVLKQNSTQDNLNYSWKFFKEEHIKNNGYIQSENSQEISILDQSFTLFRAAMMQDKISFDRLWNWTKDTMLLKEKNLFATAYDPQVKKQTNTGTTTEADSEIAFALLLAYRNWGEKNYLTSARDIITDIWINETVSLQKRRYIVAGNWTADTNRKVYTINPSGLLPYAYRAFASVDENHDWDSIVRTTYDVLDKCTRSTDLIASKVYIPPNWCNLNQQAEVIVADDIDKTSSYYSYNAHKVLMRTAIDYYWSQDTMPKDYIDSITFFDPPWKKDKKIYFSYTPDGNVAQKFESLSNYGSLLTFYTIKDEEIARDIYYLKILSEATNEEIGYYWGDKKNMYDQNWIWLAVSLYTNNLTLP